MATTTSSDKALYNEALKIDLKLKEVISYIQKAQQAGNVRGAYYENSFKSNLKDLEIKVKSVEDSFRNSHLNVYEQQVSRPLTRLTKDQIDAINKMRGR